MHRNAVQRAPKLQCADKALGGIWCHCFNLALPDSPCLSLSPHAARWNVLLTHRTRRPASRSLALLASWRPNRTVFIGVWQKTGATICGMRRQKTDVQTKRYVPLGALASILPVRVRCPISCRFGPRIAAFCRNVPPFAESPSQAARVPIAPSSRNSGRCRRFCVRSRARGTRAAKRAKPLDRAQNRHGKSLWPQWHFMPLGLKDNLFFEQFAECFCVQEIRQTGVS